MSSELRKLWEHAGGQLPEDWAIVPLESLFRDPKSIAVGVMYPGPDTPGGIPLLKVGDIKDGIVPTKPSYCISAETDEEHKRTKLVGDELLITLVGNPGECVVVSPEMAGWNPARAIAVVRLQDTSLRTYLKTVLESTAGQHLIDAVLNTTVQKTLNLKDIRKLPIPMPTSGEIESISSISEALTNRIALLRETNATLEAIAQALFKSWFVDFDPVRAKMESRVPEGMDEATAVLFPDGLGDSELGAMPTGWRVRRLGDVASYLSRGISPKYLEDGGVLVLNQKCVRDFSVDYCKGRRHDSLQRKIEGRQVAIGDVLVNSTGVGTLGRVAQVLSLPEAAVIVDSHVTIVRPGPNLSWPYLGQFMMRKQPDIEAMGEGSTGQTELSRSKLADVLVLVPPEDVLEAFDQIVIPMKQRVSLNDSGIQNMAMLRDTLLPRLISGQLRLPTPEEKFSLPPTPTL